MLHSTTHDGHGEFYRLLHTSKEQITVFDYEEYPQFMQNDTKNQRFFPVTPEGTELEEAYKDASQMTGFLTVFKLIAAFLNQLFVYLK